MVCFFSILFNRLQLKQNIPPGVFIKGYENFILLYCSYPAEFSTILYPLDFNPLSPCTANFKDVQQI